MAEVRPRVEFKEKLSPILRRKIAELTDQYDALFPVVRKLTRQYLADPAERHIDEALERRRHYDAEMPTVYEGKPLHGLERLYRRVILIEPTTVCAAHCRYCLRAHYEPLHLREDELLLLARYCGDEAHCREVREVLITGGDPLMIPTRLNFLIDALAEHAPNIRHIRVGSRVPLQAPERVEEDILHALRKRPALQIEIGTHVNHAVELFPEVNAAFHKLQDAGCRIYNQSVLMRGVNDSIEDLVELFDALRALWIEPHYLFHCVPMQGMAHFRTTLEEGLELTRALVMSGAVSGRAKPMYTAMTDIGKITLYQGTIVKRKGRHVLLQSNYAVEERIQWNPQWAQPDSVEIDPHGRMRVWYLDGENGAA
ncbi:MAG TPA: radical SAM protein [Candidatus Hydrogenedentes bacterium]|nr:radical SAM protein [Candidatus Hydrogenedentota bacterium]